MTGAITRRYLGGALAIGLIVGGCAKKEEGEQAAVQDTAAAMAPAPAAPAQAGPSDAEIAHIVVTANTIDIDLAKVAKDNSKNAEVKKFADQMIKDHSASNDSAKALAGRLNLTPADNSTSQSLKSSADQTMNNLKNLKGAEFDKAYITNEVTYHQQVLDALDNTLIPNAQNPELKALLQKTRPIVASHLDMAKSIQSKMGTTT